MTPPEKPFDGYKWRWAVYAPTESLNNPPIFLGVLRALRQFEGQPPSSAGLITALEEVERETKSPVRLGRTSDRNLIRNSGQYWKIFGLLEDRSGIIILTDFGKQAVNKPLLQSKRKVNLVKLIITVNKMPIIRDIK